MSLPNIHDRLGKTFACSCGKTHTIPLKTLLYDEQAISRLPEILGSIITGRRLTLLADKRTYTVAGKQAQQVLLQSGWSVQTLIVPDTEHGTPICDDITHAALKPNVDPADLLLAVGGGVINDLTKWLAFDLNLPYAVVATAASMNGYTAANVAPTLKGVKRIVYARAPIAAVAVPSIIAAAPFELTASGLGDVIAKPISTADWIMNHLFFDEYFCTETSEMISAIEPYYFDHPDDVRNRKPQAIQAMFEALIYSGIAMTMVGTSAPASGGEHMLSHTLDMMTSVDGVPHDLHGRQVGLGTIFAAALYEKIFRIEKPKCIAMPEKIDRQFWGRLADPVAEQYALKQDHLKRMREKISDPDVWRKFLSTVQQKIRPADAIKQCLRQADAAHTLADIRCSPERMLSAVLHMHEIRKRCTVVDLAWTIGILPNAANELIDRWLVS